MIENTPVPAQAVPLETSPEDQLPIIGVIPTMEAILRQPRRVLFQLRGNRPRLLLAMLLIALMCSLTYGLVVGTFSGKQQLWAAPIKIASGLLLSGLICLPSLYILSCLSGSTARLTEVIGFLAGLLALTTVLLIGFAPVAWVFSQSTESVAMMGILHLAFWLVAICFGIRFLQIGFSQLASATSIGIKVWVIIFLLVQLQMTSALRPIIGQADTFLPKEKKFFLAHWFETLDKDAKPTNQRAFRD
jgi:hypothetical protein